jgi:hypothetical protein
MSYHIKFKDVRDSMTNYGICITDAEIYEVFEHDPKLQSELEMVGEWETCCREAFVNAIGHWLGLKGDWPKGANTEEYANAYFLCFKQAADRMGLKLYSDWD